MRRPDEWPVPRLHPGRLLRYCGALMSEDTPQKPQTEAERRAARKAERLAGELRANLQRRKAQLRARREGKPDETEGLPAAGKSETQGE